MGFLNKILHGVHNSRAKTATRQLLSSDDPNFDYIQSTIAELNTDDTESKELKRRIEQKFS